MEGSRPGWPMWDETRRLVGCAMSVLNALGHGLLEKTYENALVVEFQYQGIPYIQQPRYKVTYRGQHVGYFVPDLVAFGELVVDAKTVERLGQAEQAQILNYLRISGLRVGLLLNFHRPRLEWKRIVL